MQRGNGNRSSTIPLDLLDDIASRFLLDAPDSELKDPISLCFLTELAYWFYLDEYVEEDNSLNNIKFDSFALQLLQHVKISPLKGSLEEMLQNFRDFKHRVPTYGALILNDDLSQVLLVQGFWHRASWGFPKGKINVEEEPFKCAIREVLEETGFDISSKIDKDIYLEATLGEQKVRLYIIPGVSMMTEFIPRTKGEIKELRWFPINQLPSHKHDRSFPKTEGATNMFYMVMPFVKSLREWVAMESKNGNILSDKNECGREARRRHCSLNSNFESSSHTLYNSSCLSYSVQISSADVTKAKNHPALVSSPLVENNLDRSRSGADSSPRKRETKSKSKGKKNMSASGENAPNDENTQSKFTFKNRNRVKGNFQLTTNASTSGCNVTPRNSNSSTCSSTSVPIGFRSYSWQNFRINKRAINEALDKAWSGVTLEIAG